MQPFLDVLKIIVSIFIVGSLGILSFFDVGSSLKKEAPLPSAFREEDMVEEFISVGEMETNSTLTLPINDDDTLDASAPEETISMDDERLPESSLPEEKLFEEANAPLNAQRESAITPESQTISDSESPSESQKNPSFSEINLTTREALVNIICISKTGGSLRPISGSGVIIDERGVILTNAHVAQYFLLVDYPQKDSLECIVRIGSPARPAYRASLIYLSPSWIDKNAHLIVESNPLGTGENDYAFLLITESTKQDTPLPQSFSFIVPEQNTDSLTAGENVLLAGYPAGFINGASIQRDLSIVSTIAKIEEPFTFVADTLDLLSFGGSVLAQQGASGGPAVSKENTLLGIIVTSSEEVSTADRDLRAITIGHITRSLLLQTGFDIPHLLQGDLNAKATAFNFTITPSLTARLIAEIDK